MNITGLIRSRRMSAADRMRVLEAVARFSIPQGRPLDIRDMLTQASQLLYLDVPLALWRVPRNALEVPAYLIGDGDSGVPVAVGVAKADPTDGHAKFDVMHELAHLVLGHRVEPRPLPSPIDSRHQATALPAEHEAPHLGAGLRMLLPRGLCPGEFGDPRVEGESDLFALTVLQCARPAEAGARPADVGLPGLISSLGGDAS